jgi:hypothetical protein
MKKRKGRYPRRLYLEAHRKLAALVCFKLGLPSDQKTHNFLMASLEVPINYLETVDEFEKRRAQGRKPSRHDVEEYFEPEDLGFIDVEDSESNSEQ